MKHARAKALPRTVSTRISVQPFEPGEAAWYELTDRQADVFARFHAERSASGSLCTLVIHACADIVWELCRRDARWEALDVAELFRRLAVQNRFFPQPQLVLAFYETLRGFLPWLALQGALEHVRAQRMLAELELAKSPLVDEAVAMLEARARMQSRAEPVTRPGFRLPS